MTKKKEKKKSSGFVKSLCAEVFGELFVYALAFAIGIGVMALFPYEKLENVPFEFFMFLGLMILILIVSLVIIAWLSARHLKQRRRSKDIRFIYKELKKQYTLIFMNITKIIDEKMVIFPTIRGKNADGKFDLFMEDGKFVFSVQYNAISGDKEGFCAYPCDVNEAIELIKAFMSGKTLNLSENN